MEIEVVEFILEFVLAQILFICEFLNLVGEMCFHFARIMNLSINIPIFKKALVIPVFKKIMSVTFRTIELLPYRVHFLNYFRNDKMMNYFNRFQILDDA